MFHISAQNIDCKLSPFPSWPGTVINSQLLELPLSNHYENTLIQIHWKFYHQKMAIFHKKNSEFFHVSTQNIDCGYSCGYSLEPPRRGGSNGYPQSLFFSRNKKNNVYHCKPQFYWKLGFKGTISYMCVFVMGSKFFPYIIDIFSEGDWCTEKQTGSHKSCNRCKKKKKKTLSIQECSFPIRVKGN